MRASDFSVIVPLAIHNTRFIFHVLNNINAMKILTRLTICISGLYLFFAGFNAAAQTKLTASEQRTIKYFESVKKNPLLLAAFLKQMPKGADLHMHLSGSVYAESLILWAADSGLCLNQQTLNLSAPLSGATCDSAQGLAPANRALSDPILYRRMIDAWSMRNWEYSGQSGHDQFFDTFGKFGAVTGARTGDMVAEVASRAAYNKVSYVELMYTPDGGQARQLGAQAGWNTDFAALRQKLLGSNFTNAMNSARETITQAEQKKQSLLKCGTQQADAGCNVTVRYIYQVSRAVAPEQAFAQILMGFELASVDSRVVGLNLVQPEDFYISMRDYSLQMRMLDYLHGVYPKVNVTLHAGELAPGMVPPEGLRFHIREAVQLGHAKRIGHGAGLIWEDDPFALLKEMASKNVLVEICLTSNDVILGIRGAQHPLSLYLEYGVPVALATDDLGVARSDMTREYIKAATEQNASYPQLKQMARNSLEHAFIAGQSLWSKTKPFSFVTECASDKPEQSKPSNRCGQFLQSNEQARLQWQLEAEFAAFEAGQR